MRRRSSGLTAGFVAAAILIGAPAVAGAQSTDSPLTLDAAIARAMAANHGLAAAKLAAPVAAAGVDVAREHPNPEVSYEVERETPRQAIGASLPIELGGKRQRRIDLANAAVASQGAEIDKLGIELRDRVRRAYFGLVAANRHVTLADDLRALARRARDAVQARFSAGDVPRLELLQTELALLETENDASARRGEARAAAAELNVLLAQPADAPIAVADSLSSGAIPPLDAALAVATKANTDLMVLDRQIAEQAARRDLAKAMRTPDLAAGASLTYDAEPEFSRGFRANIAMVVPLFTRYKAAVIVEDAQLAKLTAQRQATAIELSGAVAAALARATSAREQLTRSESESLPRAIEVERMAQDSYSSGQTNLAALLQTLQITREVRRKGLEAGAEYQRALADLERAIGAPLP